MKSLNLSAYAAFSSYFLTSHLVEAQVVYVDLDPDIVIDAPGVDIPFDFDGNSIYDFSFLHSSFTFYSAPYNSYKKRVDLLAKPLSTFNAIAASSHYHGTFSGGAWWYYPYALIYNSLINGLDAWKTNHQQILALITIDSEDGDVHYTPYANWFNSTIEQTIDHYLGIRFLDSENLTHYGWIRCDVVDSGTVLIIKDYAYNNTPEHGVYAGSLISSISEPLALNVNIYTYNNVLYALLNSAEEEFELYLYDLKGSIIMTETIKSDYSSFDLQAINSGVYLVEIKNQIHTYSKKILIQ